MKYAVVKTWLEGGGARPSDGVTSGYPLEAVFRSRHRAVRYARRLNETTDDTFKVVAFTQENEDVFFGRYGEHLGRSVARLAAQYQDGWTLADEQAEDERRAEAQKRRTEAEEHVLVSSGRGRGEILARRSRPLVFPTLAAAAEFAAGHDLQAFRPVPASEYQHVLNYYRATRGLEVTES